MTQQGTTKATKGTTAKERIAKLEAELAQLKGADISEVEKDNIYIAPDAYIKVMSLIPFHLNLSTKERGGGKTYKFDRFGQVKRILYSDLVDIFETHANFLESGFFYILSQDVIRHHGLDDIYKAILSKEKIEQILNEGKNPDDGVALYQSANKSQQEIIISIMTDKLVENPDAMDLNFVDRISRISGINILERAKNIKETFSPTEQQ